MALVYNEKTGEFEEKPSYGSSHSTYSSNISQQTSRTSFAYTAPSPSRTPAYSHPVTLEDKVLFYLQEHPNRMAKEIANALSVDRRDINHLLYGALARKVVRDDCFRWKLK